MKPGVVLAVVAAAVVLVRLTLRRRRRLPSPPLGGLRGRWRESDLLGETGLVARREIHERLKSRMFRVVSLLLLVVVAAAVVVPTLTRAKAGPDRVGLVAASPSLRAALQAIAKEAGAEVDLLTEPSLPAARAGLAAGRLDAVVSGRGKILVETPLLPTDTSGLARYVRAVSLSLGVERAYAAAGLTARQAAIVARARALPVESLEAGKAPRTTAESTALIGVILIFVVLTQYLTWTLMGVMEEKASRVVEVLLATVRPLQLLTGKVLGIGTVALAQATALVGVALVLAEAVGSGLVGGTAPLVMVATLVWMVLGYAFYSWLYAAAGSLAERQDQIQSLALPLSAPLIFGYIVCLTGVSSGEPSLLIRVLAYLPPTAPFAMPTLVGFGQASWWQFALSALASLAGTLGVAHLAARIYGAAVLQTGGRVRLRKLLLGSAH